jgi:hypothetical protein
MAALTAAKHGCGGQFFFAMWWESRPLWVRATRYLIALRFCGQKAGVVQNTPEKPYVSKNSGEASVIRFARDEAVQALTAGSVDAVVTDRAPPYIGYRKHGG